MGEHRQRHSSVEIKNYEAGLVLRASENLNFNSAPLRVLVDKKWFREAEKFLLSLSPSLSNSLGSIESNVSA